MLLIAHLPPITNTVDFGVCGSSLHLGKNPGSPPNPRFHTYQLNQPQTLLNDWYVLSEALSTFTSMSLGLLDKQLSTVCGFLFGRRPKQFVVQVPML